LNENVIGSCLLYACGAEHTKGMRARRLPCASILLGIQRQRPGAGVQGAGGGPLQSMPGQQHVGHAGEQPRAMTITHKQRIAPPARLCYNSA
jgi:hypothetical protein